MDIDESCKLGGNTQIGRDYEATLLGIIEQVQSSGLVLDKLLPMAKHSSVSDTITLAEVGEWIRKARRKLYQQMMEFEILDNDLADLQSELLEKTEGRDAPAVTLSLV